MVAFNDPSPRRHMPQGFPTPQDRMMQQTLLALAVCLHGWILRSRLAGGHRQRCELHRRRVQENEVASR